MPALTLLHRSKEHHGIIPTLAGPIWATCLREMAFGSDDLSQADVASVKNVEFRQDEEAIMFLLEILCGLKSPVLGETEVMGQFKTYVSSLPADHALRRDPTLLPFLMSTVKEARTKFLSATGSLTYGQIVRRWLKDIGAEDVVMFGFGSLGGEIYPWIREKTKNVVVRSMRADAGGVPFSTAPTAGDAYVIAAPVEDAVVARLAENNFVIDLRDQALQGHANVKNLNDLFSEISVLRAEREETLPRCLEFLNRKVQEYMDRHQIRPFGWEDLCG